jgi:MFS family permease
VERRLGVFADRNLVLYLCGVFGAEAGSQIVFVAIGWQVFLISHRPFDLGLVGLAIFLPTLILTLAAGVIADRFDRRAIVVASRIGEALCALGFVLLVAKNVRSVPAYLAIAVVLGAVRALARPAEKTFLRNIVGPERFVNAQAAYVTGREIVVIAGPAAGGLLIAISPSIAFGTAGGLAFISAVAYAILRVQGSPPPSEPQTWRTALAGFAFLRAQPVIAGAISLDLFAVMFGGATALLPVYADAILHVGPIGLGWLRAAPSAGAVLVAAYYTRHPPRHHIGPLAFIAVVGFGIATIAFAFSTVYWFSLFALAVMGAFDIIGGIVRNGLVQLNTPDDKRGRVIAIQAIFTTTSNEFGAFESGALAALIGTVPAVAAGGVLALAVAAVCARVFPSLRRADGFVQAPS